MRRLRFQLGNHEVAEFDLHFEASVDLKADGARIWFGVGGVVE